MPSATKITATGSDSAAHNTTHSSGSNVFRYIVFSRPAPVGVGRFGNIDYFGVGEIEVYSGGINLALGVLITTFNNDPGAGGWPPIAATDGATGWGMYGGGYLSSVPMGEGWFQLDLGTEYPISKIDIYIPFSPIVLINAQVFGSTQDISNHTFSELLTGVSGAVLLNPTPLNGMDLHQTINL